MKKLIFKKGDAVKAFQQNEVDYFMHCVNCQGMMGAGIAKQIKDTFPFVFEEYLKYCNSVKNTKELLGQTLIVDNVINLFAQHTTGTSKRQVHYGALVSCLSTLITSIEESYLTCDQKPISIAVPEYMCCGLAGGKWEVVSEMLEAMPSNVQIVVYDFN